MTIRESEDARNASRNMPNWVFWNKFIKMSLVMIPILALLLYLTFRDVNKTAKPKTEQSRHETNSLNK
jgi:hypothetical protein